jgi:plastocyanin
MPEIEITKKDGKVVFAPSDLKAVPNDIVVWINFDAEPHLIQTADGNALFPFQLAAFNGRLPAPRSPGFELRREDLEKNGEVIGQVISYKCGLHGERGTITIVDPANVPVG